MSQVARANQAIEPDVCLRREMMKHQCAAAQPVRSNFEGGAVRRERIWPAVPGRSCLLRNGIQQIVLAVVEDEFETPVDWQGCFYGRGQVWEIRRAVAVEATLEITVCRAGNAGAVAFINLRQIDAC